MALRVLVSRVELFGDTQMTYLKFCGGFDEVWLRCNQCPRNEVLLPLDDMAVRVGTGKGRCAGVAVFNATMFDAKQGAMRASVHDGEGVRGYIELQYAIENVPGMLPSSMCCAEDRSAATSPRKGSFSPRISPRHLRTLSPAATPNSQPELEDRRAAALRCRTAQDHLLELLTPANSEEDYIS